jgi:hypothetical protein
MLDLSRRRFLFLCGAAAPGLWFARKGLVLLPGRMVLGLGGICSFCGKESGSVKGLASVRGKPERICNECVELCLDIIAEEAEFDAPSRDRSGAPTSPPPGDQVAAVDPLDEILAQASANPGLSNRDLDRLIDRARAIIDGSGKAQKNEAGATLPLHCTFCDESQAEVKKLIAGPSVFICDRCIADAAALFPQLLRV